MLFEHVKTTGTFNPENVEKFTEDHFWFNREPIHPILDGLNSFYNFALRSNPLDDHGKVVECIALEGNASSDIKALISGVPSEHSRFSAPSPWYDPLPIIREIVFRMEANSVVFFEKHPAGKDDLAAFIVANDELRPKVFTNPFNGFTVVYDDPYRSQDVVVRFFM